MFIQITNQKKMIQLWKVRYISVTPDKTPTIENSKNAQSLQYKVFSSSIIQESERKCKIKLYAWLSSVGE